jgi:hypothetical protein
MPKVNCTSDISAAGPMSPRNGSMISIVRRLFGLSLVGIALAMSLPAEARLSANGMQSNSLSPNRLSSNRLASNRLSSNKLASNKLSSHRLAGNKLAGDGAFTKVAAVELPNGMRFVR